MQGRVLIIAGSDSGGGAGIQADIKTITALNGFAASAVTALTAQNTQGVHGIYPVDCDFIRQQIEVVLQDIGADCIKTGMLHNAEVIDAVVDSLDACDYQGGLVVDPVMVAKGGAALLNTDAVEALRYRLLPRASLLTPNIPEAEALTSIRIQDVPSMVAAAETLLAMGPSAVLLKGGHLEGDRLSDVLVSEHQCEVFESTRLATRHTHGTGCTTASAVAIGLAQGLSLVAAVERARDYVYRAIESAPGFGQGHGPLNHAHRCQP